MSVPRSAESPSDTSRVSVIIPAFDYARYLGSAIESVLRQDAGDLEVVVVDDGSADGTGDVVHAFGERVRYIRQEHLGAGAARNRGVREAAGHLLSFLDADDLWPAGRMRRQMKVLSDDPAIALVFGHAEEFHSPELTDAERAQLVLRRGPVRSAGTMLIRRETFVRVGEFATTWRVGEFVDWYARAIDAGVCATMMPDVLLHRRLHRNNMGRRERQAQAEYVRIVKASIDRRRAARTSAANPDRPTVD